MEEEHRHDMVYIRTDPNKPTDFSGEQRCFKCNKTVRELIKEAIKNNKNV